MHVRIAALIFATAGMLASADALAQRGGLLDPGPAGEPAVARPANRAPEYDSRIGKLTPTEIIQQKAQAKAAQRAGRIASRAWYGYSAARPTTSTTPFTGMYGAQYNGYMFGRPAAHYPTRPIVIVNP